MSFPQTRLTLVQRLAVGGTEDDWQSFLKDYWGPICRFSLRGRARSLDDAEDVAAEAFEVLWRQRLLVRWVSNRSAKLRTLLCTVVRNILSHRYRVQMGRRELWPNVVEHFETLSEASQEQVDAFYAAWVEDLVERAVESLAAHYCRQGQGDYVRVLYGRLCQGMTIAQTAEVLHLSPAVVDHYFRHARQRLAEELEHLARRQIHGHCAAEEAEQEFAAEWQGLGQYLAAHGGIEEAVRRSYELLDPVQAKKQQAAALGRATARLTSIIRQTSA